MKNLKIKSVHLDSARSFIPMEELKERVKELSSLGFTHLQLGLTDDQGWRFESLKYPSLHELGAFRKRELLTSRPSEITDKVVYGGFYTQTALKELVRFSKEYNIGIIPLVNIPGHSSCAILAYPELRSSEVLTEVPSIKGRELFKSKASTLCYTSEFTKKWVIDIFDELIDVFDSEYIHMGFDEICVSNCSRCNSCNIDSLTELLNITYNTILNRGKTPIIWWRTEKGVVIDYNRFPDLILQWWGQTSLNKSNMKFNNKVIFSQPQNLYFDYPGKIGSRLTSVDDMGTQLVQPHTLKDKIKKFPSNVIGVGACLWTENLLSERDRTKFLTPRLLDLSEILRGNILPKYETKLGGWLSSSYISSLIKLIRTSNLSKKDLIDLEFLIDELPLPEFLKFLSINYPFIDFRSIPLTKISTSLRNSLNRVKSKDIELIKNLYEYRFE